MIETLLSRLEKVTGRNGRFKACCPAHPDKTPSLSITDNGERILIHCHAGCSASDVLTAVGLTLSDLFHENAQSLSRREHIKHNPEQRFKDEMTLQVFDIERKEGKKFTRKQLEEELEIYRRIHANR